MDKLGDITLLRNLLRGHFLLKIVMNLKNKEKQKQQRKQQ